VFGYVAPNMPALDDEQKKRFRSIYCGLCHVLHQRHGQIGCATLSYDLTFLALLLNSLYEPDEERGEERCLTHPIRKHAYVSATPFTYAADMNIALAYHKCMDNWLDDRNIIARSEAGLLKRCYARVREQYPEKCRAIEQWLDEIHQIEAAPSSEIDAPVNSTGRMLGELFVWKNDVWAESLRTIGNGIGRYIYFMDAYDDLSKDIKRNSFNPLKQYCDHSDFEVMCKDALTMMVADSTQEFEQLPIIQDVDLLRNILYSGIWSKYVLIQKKKEEAKSKGVK